MQFLLHPQTSSKSRKMCGNGIPSLSAEGSQSIPLIPDSPGTRLYPQLHKIPTFLWKNNVAEAILQICTPTGPTKALCTLLFLPNLSRILLLFPYSELNAAIVPGFSFLQQNKLLALLGHTQSYFTF